MKVRLWVLFIYGFTFSYCQTIDNPSQNPCNGKLTCHECIQTPTCGWCADPNHSIKNGRCFQQSEGCHPDYSYNPDNEYTKLENRELSQGTRNFSSSSSSSVSIHEESGSSSSGHYHHHEAVQFSPQRVKLRLRINEKYRIKMSYAQAEDYPVDLYYLMDLSKSMEDDKDKLSVLGNLLAESMQNITSNFRLGFGSFVDKVVMPYVSVVPKNLIEPCTRCEAPYGYQNVMSLSTNTSRFAGEVRRAAVSGNLDAPEGGFDAIMQAVVCREQIGWRQKARRLLVFSTDAGFHYAGDGKLGGIVKPNDGLCHLDRKGSYTHSTLQDYPSISQINQKVKQNSINLIFAVTSGQLEVYQKLQNHIEGSSAGQLSNDSANVVDLVKEQYNKITSSVELKDNASDKLKISYFSNCLDGTGPLIETNKCDGLKVGTVVKFEAEIEVKSCPVNKSEWTQTFQIYPVGINESLTVNLEMICDCPCENKGGVGYKEKAEECNGYGTYQCGVCKCDSSRFGLKCECDENTSQKHGGTGCRPDNTTKIDCSGRGQCICGQCVCDSRQSIDEKIEGTYCECDNFSCDRENGLLCSGEDHGICKCGRCVCNSGWTGPACGCRSSVDSCIPPGGGEVCSGKGVCECGVCKCNTEEEGRYSGRYCEKCPTCPGRCMELKHCIQCQVYKSGPLSEEECAANCTSFVPVIVDVVEVDESKDENLCTYFDEEDCRYTYVYTYDEKGKLVVRAQKELECPPQVYVLGIVIGVIAAIVLIGLAILLLWKLLTTIHDRREFAKFEKERKMAKWDTGENPIYKQATSTFKNPIYAGK